MYIYICNMKRFVVSYAYYDPTDPFLILLETNEEVEEHLTTCSLVVSCPRLNPVSTNFSVAVKHKIPEFGVSKVGLVFFFCSTCIPPKTLPGGHSNWRATILRRKLHAHVCLILVHTWPKTSLEHPQIMTVSFDCHDSWPYMSAYSCYLVWVPVWYAGCYTTLLILK